MRWEILPGATVVARCPDIQKFTTISTPAPVLLTQLPIGSTPESDAPNFKQSSCDVEVHVGDTLRQDVPSGCDARKRLLLRQRGQVQLDSAEIKDVILTGRSSTGTQEQQFLDLHAERGCRPPGARGDACSRPAHW